MKNNVLFLLTLVFTLSFFSLYAQRGVKIAYIDTEYILEKIPEYQEAINQLNAKANKWKSEVEIRLADIVGKRKNLSNEKALLTKELITEREEDINYDEKEILDYQQKRFGPNGDLYIQQKQLMQPVQDQIFSAVQDIATAKKYDFIFDKASDAVMLYTAKQHDLSDQIIRSITRTSKRKQAQSKAERRQAEQEETILDDDSGQDERAKALEVKRLEREKVVEKARQAKLDARAARIKEAEERRQKILEEREEAKQGNTNQNSTNNEDLEGNKNLENKASDAKNNQPEKEIKTRAQIIEENKQKKLAEREARIKELEERRQKILEDRKKVKDSINKN